MIKFVLDHESESRWVDISSAYNAAYNSTSAPIQQSNLPVISYI